MDLRELENDQLDEAANLLSRGMGDNPINVASFGTDMQRRGKALSRFFAAAMRGVYKRGILVGAFQDGSLVGVCGMTPPGKCQPGAGEKLKIIPSLLVAGSPQVLFRVVRWTGEWSRRDPADAHWHLGPVAVDSHLQGRGIGSMLLAAFCARVDRLGMAVYLETDKQTNVRFYERFGFAVTAEATVLGVPSWFMTRRPRT